MKHVLETKCLHANQKAHVTCNFNCYIETKELFTVSRVHPKILCLKCLSR